MNFCVAAAVVVAYSSVGNRNGAYLIHNSDTLPMNVAAAVCARVCAFFLFFVSAHSLHLGCTTHSISPHTFDADIIFPPQ